MAEELKIEDRLKKFDAKINERLQRKTERTEKLVTDVRK